MANQQRRSRAVQIVGVNAPTLPTNTQPSPVTPPELPDVTRQKWNQVREDVEDIYNAQLEAQKARVEMRTAELKSRGHSDAGAALGGIAEAISTAAGHYMKLEQAKREAEAKRLSEEEKRRAEEEKRRLEALEFQTSVDLQDHVAQFLITVGETANTASPDEAQAEADRIISRAIEAGLPAEVAQQLRTRTFEAVNSVRQRQVDALLTQAERLQTNQRSATRALLQGQLAPIIAQINQARTPDEAQQVYNVVLQQLASFGDGELTPAQKLEIVVPLLEQYTTAFANNQVGFANIARDMQALQELVQLAPQWEYQFAGDESAFIRARTEFALSRGIDPGRLAIFAPSPGERAVSQLNLTQTQQQLSQLADETLFRELMANPADAAALFAQKAHELINNPLQMEQFLAIPQELMNPTQRALRAFVNNVNERYREIEETDNRLLQLYQELQAKGYQSVAEEPVRLRAVPIMDITGQITAFQAVRLPDGTVVQPRANVSQAEVAAIQQRYRTLLAQQQNAVNALASMGFNGRNRASQEYLGAITARSNEVIERYRQRAEALRSVATPNFNTGAAGTSASVAPQPMQQIRDGNREFLVPLRAVAPGSMVITGRYGDNRGTHRHNGIDIAFTGEAARRRIGVTTVSGGTVIAVRMGGVTGYHSMIQVQTDEGYIEEFGHLWGSSVREGQRVAPGEQIAWLPSENEFYKRDGDRTSGNHLHFTVRRAGTVDFNGGNSVDPIEYLQRQTARLQSLTANTGRGVGLPPNQTMSGVVPQAIRAPGGQMFFPSALSSTSAFLADLNARLGLTSNNIAQPRTPMPASRAPIHRSAYSTQNNPNANYGYAYLRDNPRVAQALNEVATRLNIPGQWLADIIDFESRWRADAQNSDGAVGLIQFLPETIRLFQQNNPRWKPEWTADAIRRMSPEEQLRNPIYVYLTDAPFRRGFNTIEDLHAAIFLGAPGYLATPQRRATMGDRNITFAEYAKRLGERVGRRYQTSYDITPGVVHNAYTAGCPICAAQMQSIRTVFPHRAP